MVVSAWSSVACIANRHGQAYQDFSCVRNMNACFAHYTAINRSKVLTRHFSKCGSSLWQYSSSSFWNLIWQSLGKNITKSIHMSLGPFPIIQTLKVWVNDFLVLRLLFMIQLQNSWSWRTRIQVHPTVLISNKTKHKILWDHLLCICCFFPGDEKAIRKFLKFLFCPPPFASFYFLSYSYLILTCTTVWICWHFYWITAAVIYIILLLRKMKICFFEKSLGIFFKPQIVSCWVTPPPPPRPWTLAFQSGSLLLIEDSAMGFLTASQCVGSLRNF